VSRVHLPETLEEAVTVLADAEDAMVYGGGTAIQILRKQGLLFVEDFVDIGRVPGLDELTERDGELWIGPMVTLRRVETDPLVRRLAPLAAQTYAHVANPRVRNTASAGGNIAHGDYRLDPPTALVTLDARVELTSVDGSREVYVREFFTDFQETAVEHGEMITAIIVPPQPTGAPASYTKYSSLSENDWPCASAASMAVQDGEVVEMRLGLGALAPTTLYLAYDITPDMSEEQALEAALEIADSAMDPIADIRGSATYKAELGRVAVEDSVRRTLKELNR
jgi:aerobic carbon-monoxide dehydrogenase medium subunit